MVENGNLEFASDYDGKEVKVITCVLGIVEDKYPVHPDWCKEVEEEEIIKDMFEPGKKYVFDAELCRKDGYESVSYWQGGDGQDHVPP